nr:hypothetical transcript [Hymenolepis microstoma]
MPSQSEIETVLKGKAVDGKIKTKDVLAALPVLGIASDKVEHYLNEKKDAANQAVDGKIKTKDVLAALPVLGIASDKVEHYLNEKKDAANQVGLAETVTFIASL